MSLSFAVESGSPCLEESILTLPSGVLRMGGRKHDKFTSSVEMPVHTVTFSNPFGIRATPVTIAQWQKYRPDEFPDCNPLLPVTGKNWESIHLYLNWLREETQCPYRLPTEAEWEYACRAGSETIFPCGNIVSEKEANFTYDESGDIVGNGKPSPVGSYPANTWGLFDMMGNVSEWVQDAWHGSYHGAPSDGSAWESGGVPGRRVIRGGAWDQIPRVLRASWRDWAPESAQWDNLGFRLALTLS